MDDALFTPDPDIPMVSAKDIQVLVLTNNTIVWVPLCKVCVDGDVLLAKASRKGLLPAPRLTTEMRKMFLNDKARNRFDLENPTGQLLGHVADAHMGTIYDSWVNGSDQVRTAGHSTQSTYGRGLATMESSEPSRLKRPSKIFALSASSEVTTSPSISSWTKMCSHHWAALFTQG